MKGGLQMKEKKKYVDKIAEEMKVFTKGKKEPWVKKFGKKK